MATVHQLDLIDEAPRQAVGFGGARIGKSLRALQLAGVVTISPSESGFKVAITEAGRVFLSALRASRGRI